MTSPVSTRSSDFDTTPDTAPPTAATQPTTLGRMQSGPTTVHTRKFHLATELWSMVFSELPLRDLLAVSWTCRQFRRQVLDTAKLWTDFEIAAPQYYRRTIEEDQRSICNIDLLALVLERSKNLLLQAQVVVSLLLRLEVSDALALYDRRATRLEVSLWDGAKLFKRPMLVLEELSIGSVNWTSGGSVHFSLGAMVGVGCTPALRTLRTYNEVDWCRVPAGLFPTVRDLELCIYRAQDVATALLACPALDEIEMIVCAPLDSDEDLLDAGLVQRARSVQSVRIEVNAACSVLLSFFDCSSARRHFSIDCEHVWPDAAALFRGFSGPPQYKHKDYKHQIKATNPHDDVRELTAQWNTGPAWKEFYARIGLKS